MTLWLVAGGLGGLGLTILTIWCLLKRMEARQIARLDGLGAHLLNRLDALVVQPTPNATPTPWLGSFLPTDAHQHAMERQMRAAEDHAISAAGPIPSSLPPLPRSERSVGRAGSTRPARASGNR